MTKSIRILAGDCTVIEDQAGDRREYRGRVVVLAKPDGTVIVHDEDGYQPVAWLTRADAVTWTPGPDPDGDDTPGPGHCQPTDVALTARTDDASIRVTVHEETDIGRYPATVAGTPVGHCPTCAGHLVRDGRAVTCTGCGDGFPLPAGTTVRDDRCSCGYPTIRTERGTAFELCLDRNCDHARDLDEAVRAAFDEVWDCPSCGASLRVVRRSGLLLRCECYPDCETGFRLPTGTVIGTTCGCGLPRFETPQGRRCLDANCTHRPGTDLGTDRAGPNDREVET